MWGASAMKRAWEVCVNIAIDTIVMLPDQNIADAMGSHSTTNNLHCEITARKTGFRKSMNSGDLFLWWLNSGCMYKRMAQDLQAF